MQAPCHAAASCRFLLLLRCTGWYTPAPAVAARVQAAPTQHFHQQQYQQPPTSAPTTTTTNSSSGRQQEQQPGGYGMSASGSSSSSDSESGPVRVPLKLVVQDAVKRWFNEALSEARRGDVKQQALLAQMYLEGYGCKQDLEQAKIWAERAKQRGYQMAGVYCSAP